MITILLWITLILSVLTLIIIASPLRLTVDFSYRGPDNAKYGLIFSYLHPWVFSYAQTSEDDAPRMTVFGVRMKSKDVSDDDKVIEADDIVKDAADDGGSDDDSNIWDDIGNDIDNDIDDDNISNDVKDNDNEKNADSEADNGGINTDNNDGGENADDGIDLDTSSQEEPKEESIRSRVKSYIAEIKESKLYKMYDDKPLRAKLLKWAYRLPNRILKSIPLEKLKLHTTVGYRKDPAVLGKTCGYFNAAKYALLRGNPAIDMYMRPIFTKNHFEIDTELSIKSSISIILRQLSIIIITFPCLRVYKIMKNEN